jgi:hypothetical protein
MVMKLLPPLFVNREEFAMTVSPESNLQNLRAEFAACLLKLYLVQLLAASHLAATTVAAVALIPEPNSLSLTLEEVEAKVEKDL